MVTKLAERKTRLVTAQRQAEVEESLQQLAYYLDGLFRIPLVGWRFGLDALIGLIPGAGDWLTSVVSFYILAAAVRYRVPKITILRMALNIAVDYLVGTVPVVGDLLDAVWKSNQKNLRLLVERSQLGPGEKPRASLGDWLFIGVIMLILLGLLAGSFAAGAYLIYYIFKNTPLL